MDYTQGLLPPHSGASFPFYLLEMTKNSWGFDITTIVFFNKSYINLMPTWRLLFIFPHQYDLISLENKYYGLHSGTRLKNNLLSCCFIARNIYVTYSMRLPPISDLELLSYSIVWIDGAKALFLRKTKKTKQKIDCLLCFVRTCISLSLQLPYLEKAYYTILSSIRMNLYKARLQIVLSK